MIAPANPADRDHPHRAQDVGDQPDQAVEGVLVGGMQCLYPSGLGLPWRTSIFVVIRATVEPLARQRGTGPYASSKSRR